MYTQTYTHSVFGCTLSHVHKDTHTYKQGYIAPLSLVSKHLNAQMTEETNPFNANCLHTVISFSNEVLRKDSS